MKEKRLIFAVCTIVIATILAVLGFFILPDVVVVQITMSGEAGNTMPKLAGVLIPFAVSAGCACAFYMTKNNRYLLISGVGIVLSLLILLTNLA